MGAFTRPCIRGPHVKYFDVLNREELVKRAEEIGYRFDDAPYIDFVSPTGDLSVVDKQFAVCFSSHCVEHQPDLIEHFNRVEEILLPGGKYALVIPDKRYCFDHFIPESSIADVLDARGRHVHTLGNIVRHRALVTHNDAVRHWKGDHGYPRGTDNLAFVQQALREYREANGGYVDVHAWQFTPVTFRQIVDVLLQLKMINLRIDAVYPTPWGRFEFCAVLSKNK